MSPRDAVDLELELIAKDERIRELEAQVRALDVQLRGTRSLVTSARGLAGQNRRVLRFAEADAARRALRAAVRDWDGAAPLPEYLGGLAAQIDAHMANLTAGVDGD